MSYSTQHAFRPVEATVDLSQIQFADYPNRNVQVADYTQVEYLQPSDSEEDFEEDEDMDFESKLLPAVVQCSITIIVTNSHTRWCWP